MYNIRNYYQAKSVVTMVSLGAIQSSNNVIMTTYDNAFDRSLKLDLISN